MSDESYEADAEIIRAAYAEKVKEAFKVFAENIGMGQGQASSKERFLRSLDLVRRARDIALAAASEAPVIVEPTVRREAEQGEGESLSAEERSMIEQAVAGTTGHKRI